MNIRYDYYTKDAAAAMKAMAAAADAAPRKENVSLSYDADDGIWNICGSADHNNLTELFNVFESEGFTDDRYEL